MFLEMHLLPRKQGICLNMVWELTVFQGRAKQGCARKWLVRHVKVKRFKQVRVKGGRNCDFFNSSQLVAQRTNPPDEFKVRRFSVCTEKMILS